MKSSPLLNVGLVIYPLLLICWSRQSHASYSGPYYYRDWFPKPVWRQYTSWYSKATGYFAETSAGVCNETLSDYNEAFNAPSASTESHYLLAICYQHESYLLDHVSSNSLMNFQSASVILGLMPTLLSTIGPTVSEIGVLSSHRPILSFLVSMGAPAIWPTRAFAYNDITVALKLDFSNELERLLLKRIGPKILVAMSMVQYILALAAIVNVITNSIEIGQKTVLSWGCTTQFLPLLWAIMPCIIHATAALGYLLTRRKTPESGVRQGSHSRSTPTSPVEPKSQSPNAKGAVVSMQNQPRTESQPRKCSLAILKRPWSHFLLAFRYEVTVCANQHCECLSEKGHVSILAAVLNFAAGIFAFIHMIFGVMIFSSLQLITVWDALNHVLWRYVASTVVCRVILCIELGGIRGHKKKIYV